MNFNFIFFHSLLFFFAQKNNIFLNFFLLNYFKVATSFFLKRQASLKFFFFLFYTLQFYFKKKNKFNFLCYFKEYKNTQKNDLLFNYFQKNVKKNFIQKAAWLSSKQFFFFILQTLIKKDTDFFLLNLNFFLSILPLYFYKKIFSWIILIIKFLTPFFFFSLKIYGLYFLIKGKLGLKGGLKKKCLLYKFKKTSFSNLQLKLSYSEISLKTKVGSIGLKLFIFY